MEAFHKLMASHIAQRDLAVEVDNKTADDTLREGLDISLDILCEIEAKSSTQCRDFQNIESLLCDLRTYRSCPVESGRRNLSYITAELAGFIATKLVNYPEMCEKVSGIQKPYSKNIPGVCTCGSFNNSKHLEELVQILLELKTVNRIQESSFVSSVIELRLPVEVLSTLQKADLVSVSSYAMHIVDRKYMLDSFVQDLISHLGRNRCKNDEDSSSELCEASVHLLATLLRMALGDEIAEPAPAVLQLCNKACHDVLDQIITQMPEHVLSKEVGVSPGKHFLQLCAPKWHLGRHLLQKFYLLSLKSLATGPSTSNERALALQQHWLHVEISPSLSMFLQNLLIAMGREVAFSGISSMIEEESSKWQNILAFITAYLTHLPEAATTLKAFVDESLGRSLTRHSRSVLSSAFLLARQACLTTVPAVRRVFPSYGTWFGSTFGVEAGSSVQTSINAGTFEFFMSFLTDLVPTDPPLCLRVHINKVPSAPAQCSHLLNDYVSLAKTRLQDLGETTGSGLFAFEFTPGEDVAAALAHFESSGGQMSRVLLDSSRFRRAQYEKQFLPVLLVPEPILDERSSRQLLITKLLAAGKIPLSMFQQYDMACQHLTLQHSGQCKSVVPVGTPLERWQAVLELLVDTVRNGGVDDTGSLAEKGKAAISVVASQLETLLKWSAGQPDTGTIYQKVIGKLLKACELSFEPPTPLGIERSLAWPRCVVTLLMSQPALLQKFRGAMFRVACNIMLPSHMTQAAAAFACVMDLEETEISCQSSGNESFCADSSTLGERIGQALQPFNQRSMTHALVFCSSYLRLFNEACAGLSATWRMPSLVRMLVYLHERLVHSSSKEVLDVCAQSWNVDSAWTIGVTEAQLNLLEWLDFEAAINPEEDPVQMRHQYICGWIMQHCNSCPAPELFTAVLKYNREGRTAWGRELLHAIPSVVVPMESSSQTVDSVPWLLETWKEISVRFSYEDIFKAVQHLPPWMLLTNYPGAKPTAAAVDALVHLVTWQMEKMSEGNFLSLGVMCLVIGAVRATDPHHPGEILSQIVDASPALHLGILRHGHHVQIQLGPIFKASYPLGSNIMRMINIIMSDIEEPTGRDSHNWEVGLVYWSRGALLPRIDDGSLFFHMLDLGSKLLLGTVNMAMVSQGPVLPSVLQMSALLVQEPLQCLKMLKDAIRSERQRLPAAGLSKRACAGLSLATMGTILSFTDDQLPISNGNAAKMCSQVLQQSLHFWKESCLELDLCDPTIREVTFVHWLRKRIHALTEYLSLEASKIDIIDLSE